MCCLGIELEYWEGACPERVGSMLSNGGCGPPRAHLYMVPKMRPSLRETMIQECERSKSASRQRKVLVFPVNVPVNIRIEPKLE